MGILAPTWCPFNYMNPFNKLSLLVAGETCLDVYLNGMPGKKNPESSAPIINVLETEYRLGMSANVANNVNSLGGNSELLSILGSDSSGRIIKNLAIEKKISAQFFTDPFRPTIKKVRISAPHPILRLDIENSRPLPEPLSEIYLNSIQATLPNFNGVILQDYGKGIWTPKTTEFIAKAKKLKIPVYVDPHRNTNPTLYKGATLLTPNLEEAQILSQEENLSKIIRKLKKITGAQVIITLGAEGMAISHGNSYKKIPALSNSPVDVTGAGDTVIAMLALCHLSGYSLIRSAELSSIAAKVVVEKFGTSAVTWDEIQRFL